MPRRISLLALTLLALSALGARRARPGEPGDKEAERAGEDSIWGASTTNLLREKEVKEHDLVTIVIKESSKSSTKLETDLEKDTELSLGLAKAISLKRTKGGVTYKPSTKTPELDIKHSRKLEGSGEIAQDTKFEAKITAEIIEIYPNGTCLLEARKRVTINEECTTLILTGRIRPEDIKSDNTVDSDRVADSHIQYRPKGAVADANRRGWLHRLFDFVNIF